MDQANPLSERNVASSEGKVDLKLEVVTIPVSDIDRAKEFFR